MVMAEHMERMVSLPQQELPVQIDVYIQEHFTEKIDAVRIAPYFGIGKTQLYKIVRQSYGMGIAEHIRTLRIAKAKHLLSERPDLALAEIAAQNLRQSTGERMALKEPPLPPLPLQFIPFSYNFTKILLCLIVLGRVPQDC